MPRNAVPAQKPISAFKKPLTIDAKGLFKSLTKAVAHGASGKWMDVGTDTGEIVTAIGLKTTPEELAWTLIYRSLKQALFELVSPNFYLLPKEADAHVEALSIDLDITFETAEISLDQQFFYRPADLPLLVPVQESLNRWLTDFELEPARAATIVARLPIFFTAALHQEWKRHANLYAPLLTTSPFSNALDREQEWAAYYAWLNQQVQESMLQETFSLSQVYVPLRAYYEKHGKNERTDYEPTRKTERDKKRPRVIVDLQDHLNSWLDKADKNKPLCVLSGGPGSGKSSFGKIWAAQLTSRVDLRVLFIPLHLYDAKKSLENAIAEFTKGDGFLTENPCEALDGNSRLLLIFDGLDELALRGKLAEEVARDFVRDLKSKLSHWNQRKLRVQALISGREVIIQSNSTELRNEGEVLEVLSFHEEMLIEDVNIELLEEDQRDQWWQRYGQVIGKPYLTLPEQLQREDLDEITAQPLLNYLVALSFDGGSKAGQEERTLDFSGEISLNRIYDDLLRKVYKRGWEGGRNPAAQGLTEPQFIRVMEEVALAAWHGNGRTTTVRTIEKHCHSSGLGPLLQRFEVGAEAGVTGLLAAFYFRQFGAEQDGERTFEFTHKSFGEYLFARRIVGAMARIQEERQRNENFQGGWTEEEALKHWAEICSPSSLNGNSLKFLQEEVELRDESQVKEWQTIFCRLVEAVLRRGIPMELLSPRNTYKKEDEGARNAEETLLAALSSCAWKTTELSQINWPTPQSFGNWITRLQCVDQRGIIIAISCLCYLDLKDCDLSWRDFFAANFTGSNLQGADFVRSELSEASFFDANLQEAILISSVASGTNFSHAKLVCADLSEAELNYSIFYNSDLTDAIFKGVNGLTTASFSDALGMANDFAHSLVALGNSSVKEREI